MEVRKATGEEMLHLWKREHYDSMAPSPTALFFVQNIESGNAEFWALEDNGQIIGEIYIFWRLDDRDFADGKSRAYLCAFRVKKGYRGKGYGTFLIKNILEYVKSKGVPIATIGVAETEEQNIRLYHRLGFTHKIKDCFEDPCNVNEEMEPNSCPCFWLLSKDLE